MNLRLMKAHILRQEEILDILLKRTSGPIELLTLPNKENEEIMNQLPVQSIDNLEEIEKKIESEEMQHNLVSVYLLHK